MGSSRPTAKSGPVSPAVAAAGEEEFYELPPINLTPEELAVKRYGISVVAPDLLKSGPLASQLKVSWRRGPPLRPPHNGSHLQLDGYTHPPLPLCTAGLERMVHETHQTGQATRPGAFWQ